MFLVPLKNRRNLDVPTFPRNLGALKGLSGNEVKIWDPKNFWLTHHV
jgi:hypothetical protein